MNTIELKDRLSSLYTDITVSGEDALKLINRFNDVSGDKKKLIDDLYFKENSPVRVINTQFLPKGEGDVTAEMLDLSIHYDEYIERLRKQITNIVERHEIAVRLFMIILNLKPKYSDILYLRYYKRLSTDEIMDKLDMKRSPYFRYHASALEMLRQEYNDIYETSADT